MSTQFKIPNTEIVINPDTGTIIFIPCKLQLLSKLNQYTEIIVILTDLLRQKSPQDRLTHMFTKQHELQERLGTIQKIKISPKMQQCFIDKMILAVHEEASEILRETSSKHKSMPFGWKENNTFNTLEYKKEVIDLWHFVMNLWLAVDGTPDDFYQLYLLKNQTNHCRQDENY